jgi:tRNA pseudouridine55 synthase
MRAATTAIDGLLLIDKPAKLTSHDVVDAARRSLGVSRVGHAGTLDPFATGLLVLLVGRGTRLLPYLEGEPKIYDAVIQFGAETDTDDATGAVTRRADLPSETAVDNAMARLTGVLEQTPPAYSAKKVGGRRAYAAARRGQAFDLKSSTVTVHSWTTVSRTESTLRARIECSSGTYVRALARDLGRGSVGAAHLTALRRLRSGPFTIEESQTIDELRAGAGRLHPLLEAIPSMASQRVEDDEINRLARGQAIPAASDSARVSLLDADGVLVAIGERSGETIRPVLVLRDVP